MLATSHIFKKNINKTFFSNTKLYFKTTFCLQRHDTVLFSTQTQPSTSSGLVSTIPSNLHIADMKIFEAPIPPKITPMEYLFPILHLPPTINVHLFDKPGQISETPALLNSNIFCVAIRKDIILECIRHQRHKMRQPKKTKRKSEIAGSNKKPRPQKGQYISSSTYNIM